MQKIKLPIRFSNNDGAGKINQTIQLSPENTGLLLIDCDGDCGEGCNRVINDQISAVLNAVRWVGIQPIFIYGDGRMHDGNHSRAVEYHRERRGHEPHQELWRPKQPDWAESIQPRENEPRIGKITQNAFVGTYLDSYLRSHAIETLILVGFSFKSCLFNTAVGAFERNYRVIFLRDGTDPPGENEYPDTTDKKLEGGGWVRIILTRQIEDHLEYSSTCRELVTACNQIQNAIQLGK